MPKRAKTTRPKAKPNGERASVMGGATDLMGRTLSGAADVGREVGVTAIAAARGTMRTAEQIGGDFLAAARGAVGGTIDAVERIGSAANRAVKQIVNAEQSSPKTSGAVSRRNRAARGRKA
jgi:hypothetical protein